MISDKLAKVLSIALGPQIWLPILFIIIILKSGLNSNQIKIISPSIFFFGVFVPIFYMFLAPKIGWAKKWDMEKIKERKLFFVLMLISSLISLLIIYFYGNKSLFELNFIFFFLLVIFFAITLFWKISIHTGLNTGAAIIINFLFNWKLPYLYLLIPLVLWARLKLKKHDIGQLIAGILITAFVLIEGLKYFKYL